MRGVQISSGQKGTVHTVPGVTGGAILQALACGEEQRGKSVMWFSDLESQMMNVPRKGN